MTNAEKYLFVITEWKEQTSEERDGIEEETEKVNDAFLI